MCKDTSLNLNIKDVSPLKKDSDLISVMFYSKSTNSILEFIEKYYNCPFDKVIEQYKISSNVHLHYINEVKSVRLTIGSLEYTMNKYDGPKYFDDNMHVKEGFITYKLMFDSIVVYLTYKEPLILSLKKYSNIQSVGDIDIAVYH